MRTIDLRVILALSWATAACVGDFSASNHSHHQDRMVQLPAELPRLPSHALELVAHRTLEGPSTSSFVAGFSGPRRISQKVLLLTATDFEPSFLAARDALARIGVPHQVVVATQQEITASLLTDGVSSCYFNSVIFSTSGLGYFDPTTGSWQSALSATEWAALTDFEQSCSAREAIWYAWPSPDLGLTYTSSFAWNEPVDGVVRDPSFFTRVRPDAKIPFRNAAGYRAAIIDPSTTTSLVEAVDGGVLLALHSRADGRQLLVSTVDASPYLTHSLVLEYDMIRWVTGDMFVGEKRAYLAPQVDDIFIDSDAWVVGEGNWGTVQFRLTGSDLDAFVAWQTAFQARLPAGSTFVTDMAFNGLGLQRSEYADQTLFAAAQRAGTQLTWLNHTWDHENMDGMSRRAAKSEVARNCTRARNLRFHGFSCTDLVTPDMSGLTSLPALRGMHDAGARYLVSDTSITDAIRPGSPGTNPSFNVGRANPLDPRLYQIPRHPTNIFYDVTTRETETDEYNSIYRSYYGRDLTYEEVLDKDTAFGLFYLLQGDIDPLMFHQGNLANDADGRSLYGDWIESVATKYLALTSAPILTLAQEDIGRAMQDRGKLDTCNVVATVVEKTTGRSLELRTTAACTVPVTGLAAGAYGLVEIYAGAPTTDITMSAGSVKSIPLP
jgi:hypothetical protein